MLKINTNIKLILADVDETLADVYTDATPEMVMALSKLLQKGIIVFMISGGGYKSIYERVIGKIAPKLRQKILLASCSGAEVIGFDIAGNRREPPYYSLYDQTLTEIQKNKWREMIQEIISKFHLQTFEPCSVKDFQTNISTDPLAIMLADRGPQITLEFVNAYKLNALQAKKVGIKPQTSKEYYDLRDIILPFSKQKIKEYGLPLEVDLAGMFALDFKLQGVSKTTSVKYILNNRHVLADLGLDIKSIDAPSEIEIWGDKFSEKNGGSDRYMCFAVNPEVRAIDFRHENSNEFTAGYNIVLWDGETQLQEATLEYIQQLNAALAEV